MPDRITDMRRRRARRWVFAALLMAAVSACSTQAVDGSIPPPPPPGPPPPPPPLPPPPPPEQVTATVTVNPAVAYQTMRGWEATSQAGQANPAFGNWKAALMHLAVNDLGLNRIRLEVRSGMEHPVDNYAAFRSGAISESQWKALRYAPVNDNGSASTINPAGFHFTELDESVEGIILPMRDLMAANGEQLYVNLNYVSFGLLSQAHADPAEYAEFILAVFQHLRDRYALEPDAVEVILEPDNTTIWTGPAIGHAIVATAARLAASGFHPEFIAPSTTSMARAPTWFDQVIAVPGALAHLRELSYHRYSGVSDANLAAIRARGTQHGIATAMLEHIGSGADALYKDLTVANASAWQQFTLGLPVIDNGAQYYRIVNNQPVIASRTVGLRQYFRYVRMGARRISALSGVTRVRPVGFVNPNGSMVVVIHLDQSEVLAVTGLAAGRYGISSSSADGAELGEVQVGGDGVLRFAATAPGVLTVYGKP